MPIDAYGRAPRRKHASLYGSRASGRAEGEVTEMGRANFGVPGAAEQVVDVHRTDILSGSLLAVHMVLEEDA